MLGSMGLAVPIALGVALAQPQRRVIALEGDGSILMQLGALATVAALAPKNLVDRDPWTTAPTRSPAGSRPPPASGADLVAMARGAGDRAERLGGGRGRFRGDDRSAPSREDGPWLIGCRIDNAKPEETTERDPARIRDQFMRGLGVKR